jgi:hypothetical protein
MINFRFHIASLIAVFLALAVGVVMGSTVIDRAIVDSLRSRIDTVEKRADAQRADNARLQAEVQQLQGFVDASAPWTVAGALSTPVAALAVRGVDADQAKAQVELLRRGGATTPGILWLEEPWNLSTPAQVDALRSAVGSTARNRAAVRHDGEAALATRLTAGADGTQPDLLQALLDAGFLSWEGVDGQGGTFEPIAYPGPDARVLVLGGPTGVITVKTFARDLAQDLVERSEPPVVGELFSEQDDGPDRGAWLAPIRDDAALSATLSTVDDVDMTQGRVASVLALSDVTRGVFGAYGYGAGASAPLPEPPTAR